MICARVLRQGLRLAETWAAWAVPWPCSGAVDQPTQASPAYLAGQFCLYLIMLLPCLSQAVQSLATTESLNVAAMQKTCGVNTQRWMQTLEAMPRLQSALQELESEGVRLGVKAVAAEAVDASGEPQGFVQEGLACQQMSAAASSLQQQQTHARPAR